MSATETTVPRRPSRGFPAWLSGRVTRAQRALADMLVLPARLGHDVISTREIDDR